MSNETKEKVCYIRYNPGFKSAIYETYFGYTSTVFLLLENIKEDAIIKVIANPEMKKTISLEIVPERAMEVDKFIDNPTSFVSFVKEE